MKAVKILKSRRANSTPLTIALVLCILVICCGISEYFRLMIIINGVRDGLQQSVIAVSTTNFDEVYNGLREGYSGGYVLSGNSWSEKLDYYDVYSRMDKLLGTVSQDGYHVKVQKSGYEYRYSGLTVEIANVPLTPGNTNQNFEADARIQIEIPLSFGFQMLPPLKMEVRAKAVYMPKF